MLVNNAGAAQYIVLSPGPGRSTRYQGKLKGGREWEAWWGFAAVGFRAFWGWPPRGSVPPWKSLYRVLSTIW